LAKFRSEDSASEDLRRELANNSVMTTMARLFEKGLLHHQKDGQAFIYTPVDDERSFVAAAQRAVLDSLFREDETCLTCYLADR
jgi:predicted transcriptional regulator